jgi:hypothetical protein
MAHFLRLGYVAVLDRGKSDGQDDDNAVDDFIGQSDAPFCCRCSLNICVRGENIISTTKQFSITNYQLHQLPLEMSNCILVFWVIGILM